MLKQCEKNSSCAFHESWYNVQHITKCKNPDIIHLPLFSPFHRLIKCDSSSSIQSSYPFVLHQCINLIMHHLYTIENKNKRRRMENEDRMHNDMHLACPYVNIGWKLTRLDFELFCCCFYMEDQPNLSPSFSNCDHYQLWIKEWIRMFVHNRLYKNDWQSTEKFN